MVNYGFVIYLTSDFDTNKVQFGSASRDVFLKYWSNHLDDWKTYSTWTLWELPVFRSKFNPFSIALQDSWQMGCIQPCDAICPYLLTFSPQSSHKCVILTFTTWLMLFSWKAVAPVSTFPLPTKCPFISQSPMPAELNYLCSVVPSHFIYLTEYHLAHCIMVSYILMK